MSARQLLAEKGYLIEEAGDYDRHNETLRKFIDVAKQTGGQFSGTGLAYKADEYRQWEVVGMIYNDAPIKLVVDNEFFEKKNRDRSDGSISTRFWDDRPDDDDDDSISERRGADEAELPFHPYVYCFDLRSHEYLSVHVLNLKAWEWNPDLINKLVLDEVTKDFIGMLIAGANESLSDIIAGKAGGIIVAASGPPGTGKTLTAEVFGEHAQKPLYEVQCSQLGTDEGTIEKYLNETLERASRWGAILLINEADVYIHERGRDIRQNAIVGVFLRVLEYYRGILFLTTNLGTTIDDAILSRCTAHIRYQMPGAEAAGQIWKIIGEVNNMKFSDKLIAEFVADAPGISGRDVKQLTKMLKLRSKWAGQPPSREMLTFVRRFTTITERVEQREGKALA